MFALRLTERGGNVNVSVFMVERASTNVHSLKYGIKLQVPSSGVISVQNGDDDDLVQKS